MIKLFFHWATFTGNVKEYQNEVDLWSDKIEKMLTGVRYVVNNGQNLVRLVYKIAEKLYV